MTVEGFHAKTYLYPDRVIIGSPNASLGGLGTLGEPPTRTETAVLCYDQTVLDEAAAWFEDVWRRGTLVDAPMVEAARSELAKVREARRPTLLHALAHEPSLFASFDLWVTLYQDGEVTDEATQTWEAAQGEYGEDDRRAYEERGEVPFYEVEDGQLKDCPKGRIYIDFSRAEKGKPGFNGIWKVRTAGHRSINGTGRSLVLLDRLPALRGCRIADREMKAFCAVCATFPSGDWQVSSPTIRNAAREALRAITK